MGKQRRPKLPTPSEQGWSHEHKQTQLDACGKVGRVLPETTLLTSCSLREVLISAMMILAVSENEAGTSKNLTHQAKLDAVDFGTQEPSAVNFSMKSATSILGSLRKHRSLGEKFLSAPQNKNRLHDRLRARSVPADGAVVEMILRRREACPTEHNVEELSS